MPPKCKPLIALLLSASETQSRISAPAFLMLLTTGPPLAFHPIIYLLVEMGPLTSTAVPRGGGEADIQNG